MHDLLKVVSIWTNNREVFTLGINLPGRFFDRHRAATAATLRTDRLMSMIYDVTYERYRYTVTQSARGRRITVARNVTTRTISNQELIRN